MKKSLYNMIIPYKDNETIIFNPLYGSLGKLEDDVLERFNTGSLSDEETNSLYKRHIFIDDDVNELDIINKERAEGILDPTKKVYRIWTTSGCNARCYYCFEHGMKVATMTKETMFKVADYICDRIDTGDKIRLEWFGGEPLLNTEPIIFISNMVQNKCEKVDAKYTSSIITNGSLIDESIVKIFKNAKIKRAQITLDGDKDTYNISKNYYNKDAHNFDSVLDNIQLLSDNDINISVRINYDNKNYESISSLIDVIHERFGSNKHVHSYIYPIWSSTKEEGYTSDASADNNYLKLIDKLVSYKMMKADKIIGLKRRMRQCAARSVNSIAILPDGSITKCSETFTQVIGNIDDGITDKVHYDEWTSTNLHSECKDCKYLPVCNDGCQSSRYTRMDSCFPTKDIYEDVIRWYVSYLDSKKEQTKGEDKYDK